MKLFVFPTLLLVFAATAWNKFQPVPEPVSAIVESIPPSPKPVPERIILEDSVVAWVDELADFRPLRPYRAGEEEPVIASFDSTAISAGKKPPTVSWKLLIDIKYVLTYNNKVGMEVYAPIFPDTLKNLAGKLVSIRGYVIPYDDDQKTVALSANPYASCFFCGKASPASVLSLHFAKARKRYKLDARKTFKGRLRLNYDDPEEFYYVLEEAEEI